MSRRLWSSSLGTVLFGHGVVVAALMMAPQAPLPLEDAPPLLLELAPAPLPAPAPPEPAPTPAVIPPAPALPKPVARPKPKAERRVAAAVPLPAPPAPEAVPAEPAATADPIPAAPVSAAAPPPASVPTANADPRAGSSWQGRLLAHLERNKRYPDSAQSRGLRGAVVLAFALDRGGMVVASAVRTSSGHPSLDQAALDMLQRAQPLPLPPPEVEGNPLHLVVPVRFHLN